MGDVEDEAALWMRHMRRGEMPQAWAIADAIIAREATWRNISPHRHLRPVWRGQEVRGKRVLVRCHHGLGDTIQFVRYIPRLARVTSCVILGAQTPLFPLLEQLDGVDELMALGQADREEGYEVDIEVTELPHLFRDTLDSIPAEVPYLRVGGPPPHPRRREELLVGVVHQAGDWDDRRSVPRELITLLGQPGVRILDLQPVSKRVYIPAGLGLAEGEGDLGQVGRLFCSLDLLVTVDTMSAHLAGALAIPTWTLLHAEPDWRWLEDRQDSPWYPTMRLYRQRRPGDWAGVLSGVSADLAQVRDGRRSPADCS